MDEKKQELKDVLLSLAQKYGLSAGELKNLAVEVLQDLEDKSVVQQEVIPTTSSQIVVGWYAFAGGKFSKDPAYPNCQGVVAWINPNPNAPIGERGLIITPDEVTLEWVYEDCEAGICDEEDGQANTRKLIAYGKEHGISFPAAKWCYAYSKNAVTPGEGFLPAKNQLKRIVANRDIINSALKRIGGVILDGWIWSSSEESTNYAWGVSASYGGVGDLDKGLSFYVRCVLAF